MKAPEPLIVAWQGRQLRVRHDDPRLGPYTHAGQVIRAAVELASDVDGLRLVLASTLDDRYSVRVEDDGSVVGLRGAARPCRETVGTEGRAKTMRADLTPYELEYFNWCTAANRSSLPAPELLKDMERAARLEDPDKRWKATRAVFDRAQDIARRGYGDLID